MFPHPASLSETSQAQTPPILHLTFLALILSNKNQLQNTPPGGTRSLPIQPDLKSPGGWPIGAFRSYMVTGAEAIVSKEQEPPKGSGCTNPAQQNMQLPNPVRRLECPLKGNIANMYKESHSNVFSPLLAAFETFLAPNSWNHMNATKTMENQMLEASSPCSASTKMLKCYELKK